jgi:phytoene synthase
MKSKNEIFKSGSKTYHTASLFFPERVRNDVTRLYAFVRTADDFVDKIPQDKKGFYKFRALTDKAFTSFVNNDVIADFVRLCKEYDFDKKWVDEFLNAMEQDLVKSHYATYEELEKYMYGSAEVIGLMMARILRLSKKAETAAQMQGKAMQLINFIRDVREDIDLKRQYLPQKDLERFGIKRLSPTVDENAFKKLITFEISRYKKMQEIARKGYPYIPHSTRIPVATAASMYEWTAEQILKNPMVVFEKKIKPSKARILGEYAKQFFIA